MLDYVDTKYKPLKEEICAEFYVEPNHISMEKAAQHLAGESSIGTWTELSTMNPEIAVRLRPTVYEIKRNNIKIAYPPELFESGSIPQLMSSIGGNIFGMKSVKNLRLIDIKFPKRYVKSFKGPAIGINGIRKLLKVKSRPLCGTIVKPKVGLSPAQHAKVAFQSWTGGLDIVKDDENLTDMRFNRFKDRIPKTLEARDRAQEETGERKMYMPNITAETDEMIKRADYVKDHGGEYIMIDILTAGWAALQTIRNLNTGMVIHAHRAGHAALTRNKHMGISMLTIAKMARLIGVDQLHIGTVVGKMEGNAIEVEEIEEEIDHKFIPKYRRSHHLEQRWHGLKPVFPVCSGGIHPGHVPPLTKIMGKNIIAQFGGGCHGHPDGTYAGARAIRQSIDAVMKRRKLSTYAKKHHELQRALWKWQKA